MIAFPPRGRTSARVLALALALAPGLAAAEPEPGSPPAMEIALRGLPHGEAPDRCRPIGEGTAAGPAVRLVESFRDDFDALRPPSAARGRRTSTTTAMATGAPAPSPPTTSCRSMSTRLTPARGRQPLGLDPFTVGDGVLGLVARPTPPAALPRLQGLPYVSGMISSRASFLQTYGYFEIRARLPGGAGLWPAFWLLAARGLAAGDRRDGGARRPGLCRPRALERGRRHRSSGCDIPLADGSDAFHAYGVLWTPEAVAFYLDRVPVAWMRTKPGFDRPMYMLANLAVGGWAGEPDDHHALPRDLRDRLGSPRGRSPRRPAR